VSTDEEVWQGRSLHPATPAINEKSLSSEECGLVGEWFSLQKRLGQRMVLTLWPGGMSSRLQIEGFEQTRPRASLAR
jgi:hypothetical protein